MATRSCDVQIRALRPDDVADLAHLTQFRPEERLDAKLASHLLDTDPAGCWVAEAEGEVVGLAIGIVRELTWILASYAVLPGQAPGLGGQLFAAAARHGQGCLRGLLTPPSNHATTRHYRAAGFDLHPLMHLVGVVDRGALPIVDRIPEGTAADVDLLDSVDRRARGSAHGSDHAFLLESHRLIVTDRSTGAGYAYVNPDGGPALLAATNRRTATDLLWESLAATPADAPVRVGGITAANQWAIDVGLAAGLVLDQAGYLGVRRVTPPAPYLPHPVLL